MEIVILWLDEIGFSQNIFALWDEDFNSFPFLSKFLQQKVKPLKNFSTVPCRKALLLTKRGQQKPGRELSCPEQELDRFFWIFFRKIVIFI